MAGLGSAPVGIFPFGLGTPVEAAVPTTGTPGSRYLNPSSGDYEIDSTTGGMAQMPPVRQRVLLALKTLRGSSSVLSDFGLRLPRKIDQSIDARMRDAVRVALYHLTDVERVARLDSVLTNRSGAGRIACVVAWTDLTTGSGFSETV